MWSPRPKLSPAHWPLWTVCLVQTALGAAAGFGHAPHYFTIVTVLALAGGFWLANSRAGAGRFWAAWALGLGYFGHVMVWIVEPFLVDVARHGWMAAPALFAMAGGLALFWGLAGRVSRDLWSLALAVALAEVARSYVLSGLPWGLVGYIWIESQAFQLARYVGPHGVSALTLLGAAALVARAVPLRVGAAAVLAAAVMVPPLAWTGAAADGPRVRILSPNVMQADKWAPQTREAMYQRHVALTAGAGDVDLVVWPESALTLPLSATREEILQAANGAPVLVGHQHSPDMDRFYNAASLLDPQGPARGDQIYLKSKLVPFGEYIPLTPLARRLGLTGLADRAGIGFTAGPDPHTVTVRGIGDVQVLICYEGIFPHFVRRIPQRPRAIVLMTNDGWFGTRGGPAQHLAQAQARAIEQGLPIVRSANRGISAMIDGRGQVLDYVDFGQTGALDTPLPPALAPTMYAIIGDVPILVIVMLALGAATVRRRTS